MPSSASDNNWFASWFDNPLYERLYAHRDEKEAAKLVAGLLLSYPPEAFPAVLDMGCGSGRHALLMAKKGYRVTGVDLSPLSIANAREKIKNTGIDNITFEIGDMRSYQGGPFDLVCSFFTSFGYFESDHENIRVMKNLISNMKTGGRLIMDFLNASYVRNTLRPSEKKSLSGSNCRIIRKIENDMVVKSITFRHHSDGREEHFQERVKLYGREWFEPLFKKEGLTDIRFKGDYDGSPFDAETSPRLLMTAKKPVAASHPGMVSQPLR